MVKLPVVAASATFGATTLVVSASRQAIGAPHADRQQLKHRSWCNNIRCWLGLGFGLANNEYAMTAAGTAGGATVGFGMSSDSEWDVSVAYPVGAVTVSASTDEANAWEVGAAYAADGVSAGIVLSPDNAWEITAGYAADGITVAAAFAER